MATVLFRRTTPLIALCSLLLHLLLLILFSTQHIQQLPQQAKLIFADALKKKPIIPAQPTPPKPVPLPPKQQTTLSAKTARQYAFDPSQVKALGLAHAPPSTKSTPQEETSPSESQPESVPQPITAELPTEAVTQSPQKPHVEPHKTTPKATPITDKLTQSLLMQKSTIVPSHQEIQNQQQAHTPEQKQTQPSPNTHSHTKKTSLTLAELTSGFMAHMADKPGDSAITVIGERSTQKPTAEQLMLERYCEKIVYCLEKSNHHHNHKHPQIGNDLALQMKVLISYHPHNKTHTMQILSSSGHHALDNYWQFIIQDAIGSFPQAPRPLYQQQESFPTCFTIVSSPIDQTNNWLKIKR